MCESALKSALFKGIRVEILKWRINRQINPNVCLGGVYHLWPRFFFRFHKKNVSGIHVNLCVHMYENFYCEKSRSKIWNFFLVRNIEKKFRLKGDKRNYIRNFLRAKKGVFQNRFSNLKFKSTDSFQSFSNVRRLKNNKLPRLT